MAYWSSLLEGHSCLVLESYEELLWWLLVPALLRLAEEVSPGPAQQALLAKHVEEALATAEAAGCRIDLLAGSAETAESGGEPEHSTENSKDSPPVIDSPDAEISSVKPQTGADSVSAEISVEPRGNGTL